MDQSRVHRSWSGQPLELAAHHCASLCERGLLHLAGALRGIRACLHFLQCLEVRRVIEFCDQPETFCWIDYLRNSGLFSSRRLSAAESAALPPVLPAATLACSPG